jgi:hypothetical protein
MAETLNYALLITLIGMGLVFAVILLLWGGIFLLVRLVPHKDMPDASLEQATARKRRAAAVAVAMALLHRDADEPQVFPEPPTAIVSAWQAVTRANQLRRERGRR